MIELVEMIQNRLRLREIEIYPKPKVVIDAQRVSHGNNCSSI